MRNIEPLLSPVTEASDAIRGYLYQFLYAINALLDVGARGCMWVEAFEDVAISLNNVIEGAQVKDRKAAFSLTQEKSCSMLDRWAEASQTEPDVRFLFVSTQSAGNLHDRSSAFREWVEGDKTDEKRDRIRDSLRAYLLSQYNPGGVSYPHLTSIVNDAEKFRVFWNLISWRLGQRPWLSALSDTVSRLVTLDGITEAEATDKLRAWIGAIAVSAASPDHDERKWTISKLYSSSFRPEMQRIADSIAKVLNVVENSQIQEYLAGVQEELQKIYSILLKGHASSGLLDQVPDPLGQQREFPKLIDFGTFNPPTPELFFGRMSDLDRLAAALKEANTVEIGGFPGIGKTTLVAKHLENEKQHKHLWIDCNECTTLDIVLNKIAAFLSSICADNTLENKLRSLRSDNATDIGIAAGRLEAHKCLMVFDQYEKGVNGQHEALIYACNKYFRHSRLLILSTEQLSIQSLPNVPKRIVLERLDEEASQALLQAVLSRVDAPSATSHSLRRATTMLDGHPYFLTLLASLASLISFADLLDNLPSLVNEAQEYIQSRVIDSLTDSAKTLLSRLALLHIPFHLSAINHLLDSEQALQDFRFLTKRFLISRPNQVEDRYIIHGLLLEFARRHLNAEATPEVHRRAFYYYRDLDKKDFFDFKESIYHAIHAHLYIEAEDLASRLVGGMINERRFEIMISYADELFLEPQAKYWVNVLYAKGRAQRFLLRKHAALDSYRLARVEARDEREAEIIDLEIANLLAELEDAKEKPNYSSARAVYHQLVNSKHLETRLDAEYADALLDGWSGNLEVAIPRMEESLRLYEKHGFRRNMGLACYGIAKLINDKLNDSEKAILYLEKSKHIIDTTRDELRGQNTEFEYRVMYELTALYDQIKKYDDSLRAADVCVQICQDVGLDNRLLRSFMWRARGLCNVKRFKEALDTLEEAIPCFDPFRSEIDSQQEFHRWSAVANWNLNQYEKSMEHILLCKHISRQMGERGVIFVIISPRSPDKAKIEDEDKPPEHPLLHTLVSPTPISNDELSNWVSAAVERHPELAKVGELFMVSPDTAEPSAEAAEVRPMESCPCGSGKQYRRCCGRQAT